MNDVSCPESECMCEYCIIGIEAHVPIGTRAEKLRVSYDIILTLANGDFLQANKQVNK